MDGSLPESHKVARNLILQSADYTVVDGLLFHSRVARAKRVKNLNQYQLALPQALVKTVLQYYHDNPLSGHGGIHDTLDKIKEH